MKNRNIKIKRTPVIVLVGIVLVLVLVIVLMISFNKSDDKNEHSADVNVSKINLKPSQEQDEYISKEETSVEILFENTAIPVGTSLKVTAIVSPDDNEKSLIWTSSNEEVFSVDKDGLVTVNGVGTATLTATVGSVSDAVVIEGISNVSKGSDNGFIVYTGNNHYTGSNSSGSTSGQAGQGTSGSQSQQGSSKTGSGSTDSNQTAGNSSENNQPDTDRIDSSENDGSQSGQNDNDNQGNAQGNNDSENSQNNSSNGGNSGDIGDILSDRGFEQTASNVYVCREDGVYYGEIITQSNVTIIYIKQRKAAFDSRIQSVVENLLPGNSSYVWNSYISASTDRTFTVDNRMVRIVVATGGGHSQIVIYN